ncbi:hypothetical protein GGX14DRAFT_558060 [Mycena pura]|uniref:Chromo domain-containing protein n=1 Tax=Mycena pura TaxID=153505 RepID=A0AAD6YMK1_9AGAR|nr:hypothetical protein GGX14DRAFT_558060 [Mycena pura]
MPPKDSKEERAEIERLSSIHAPPGTSAGPYDPVAKKFIIHPIEGMTEMPMGIPIVADIDGNMSTSVTVAVCFDEESLLDFPIEYTLLKPLINDLVNITWGYDGDIPIYKLPGMKRNMRSPASCAERPYDGSSSLASTLLEGNGRGFVVPAVQVNDNTAVHRRSRLVQIISSIYMILAPLALSKEEFDVTTFRSYDVNVFSFGGLNPTGLTGLQMNASSGWDGGELKLFIGMLQGSWHVDLHDDPCRWTLFILIMRLPPGSDPGPFLFARFGLYCRAVVNANGEVRLFLFFKGNDLHTGWSPQADPAERQAFLREIADKFNDSNPANRVGYVAYPTEGHTHRRVPLAITRTHGLEQSNPNLYQYYGDSTSGIPIFGDEHSWRTRLFWESLMCTWNKSVASGQPPEVLSTISVHLVRDETSQLFVEQQVHYPLPSFPSGSNALALNPAVHEKDFRFLRFLWKRHDDLSRRYLLRMSKADFRAGQTKALGVLMEQEQGATLSDALRTLQISTPSLLAFKPGKKSKKATSSAIRVGKKRKLKQSELSDGNDELSENDVPTEDDENTMDCNSGPDAETSGLLAVPSVQDQSSNTTISGPARGSESRVPASSEDVEELLSEENDDEEVEAPQYSVSFIVDYKETSEKLYLVRWSDYSPEYDSWEPEHALLSSCETLINEYWRRIEAPAKTTDLQHDERSDRSTFKSLIMHSALTNR